MTADRRILGCAAAAAMLLLSACAPAAYTIRPGCPDTAITGTASAAGTRIPLQGMLAYRSGTYRLALATMNGILLGGAEIHPDGSSRVIQAADTRARRLLATAAEICLNYLDAEQSPSASRTSSGDGSATYAGGGITLTFRNSL